MRLCAINLRINSIWLSILHPGPGAAVAAGPHAHALSVLFILGQINLEFAKLMRGNDGGVGVMA